MLFCLSHNTVCSSNNKDSTIHLSSTCDHVFNIVSMSWAVNVCVVSVVCLILNVRSGNCDSSCLLLGSFVNLIKCHSLACTKSCIKCSGNSCCKSCLTMVNVTDCTNISMWFVSFKFSLSHFTTSSFKYAYKQMFSRPGFHSLGSFMACFSIASYALLYFMLEIFSSIRNENIKVI